MCPHGEHDIVRGHIHRSLAVPLLETEPAVSKTAYMNPVIRPLALLPSRAATPLEVPQCLWNPSRNAATSQAVLFHTLVFRRFTPARIVQRNISLGRDQTQRWVARIFLLILLYEGPVAKGR